MHLSLAKLCFLCLKVNSSFREDADLKLTDTASPAVPVYFPEECGLVFMRQSPSRVHLQSVAAASQQSLWPGSSPQLPTGYPSPKLCFHCIVQQQTVQKASGCLSDFPGWFVPAESCLLPRYVCPPSPAAAQLTSGHCSHCLVPDLLQTCSKCLFPIISQPLVSVSMWGAPAQPHVPLHGALGSPAGTPGSPRASLPPALLEGMLKEASAVGIFGA